MNDLCNFLKWWRPNEHVFLQYRLTYRNMRCITATHSPGLDFPCTVHYYATRPINIKNESQI